VLAVSYDVATIGGINQANFADIMAWWDTMLGEMRTFFAEDGDGGAQSKQ
jgi:sterol desaturase/sphingolipid hydroxylase (fatty acid hydroxylase superfamily)